VDPADVKDAALGVKQVETLGLDILSSVRPTKFTVVLIALFLVPDLKEVFSFEKVVYVCHVDFALPNL